jgi:hypothetical protein
MRQSDPPIFYLVGTPKAAERYEKSLTDQPGTGSEGEVKLLAQENEVYVLTQSRDRPKERSMRRRQLKRLWNDCMS